MQATCFESDTVNNLRDATRMCRIYSGGVYVYMCNTRSFIHSFTDAYRAISEESTGTPQVQKEGLEASALACVCLMQAEGRFVALGATSRGECMDRLSCIISIYNIE